MIDVHIFELKNCATLYVVSSPDVIRYLCVFTENHHERGDLYEETLTKRILFHKAYCYVVPTTLTGRLFAFRFTRELKERNQLIDLDAYLEAFLLANPEGAASVLPFSKEELIEIAEESDWGLLFEIDKNNVVERIRKIDHN